MISIYLTIKSTNEYADTSFMAFWCGGKYGSAFLVTGFILKIHKLGILKINCKTVRLSKLNYLVQWKYLYLLVCTFASYWGRRGSSSSNFDKSHCQAMTACFRVHSSRNTTAINEFYIYYINTNFQYGTQGPYITIN